MKRSLHEQPRPSPALRCLGFLGSTESTPGPRDSRIPCRTRIVTWIEPLRLATVLCLFFSLACSSSPAPSPAGPAPADAASDDDSSLKGSAISAPAGNRAPAPNHFGTAVLRGRVKFEGRRPPTTPVSMRGDPACGRNGETVPSPRTVIAPSGGVPHVFVYVRKGITGAYDPPTAPVTLDQRGCMFAPHVFGLRVDQPLHIINSDHTIHNVHSLARRNIDFNISQPAQGMQTIRTFSKPEVMVKFRCDVHGWMEAYCGVLPHPFFAVTDTEGRFEITRLPPGEYTLETWHELWGTLRRKVAVAEGAALTVDFTYARKRKAAAAGDDRIHPDDGRSSRS